MMPRLDHTLPRRQLGYSLTHAALTIALAACTPDAPPASGPPPVTTAETASATAFTKAYAARACDHIASCCQRYGREPIDRDACLAVSELSAYPGGNPARATGFDATAAAGCLTAVSAQACYDDNAARTSACEYVLRARPTPTAQPGERCDGTDDCAPLDNGSVACANNPLPTPERFVCRATELGGRGAVCDAMSGAGAIIRGCAPDLRCDAGKCVERLDFRCGKKAKNQSEIVCGDGLGCIEDQCASAVPIGAACDETTGPPCDARFGVCRDGACQPLELNGCKP